MKGRAIGLALVSLVVWVPLASAQGNEAEQAARDFLYALYANDAVDF